MHNDPNSESSSEISKIPTETINRMLDIQEQQMMLRGRELDIQEQDQANQKEMAEKSITAVSADREHERACTLDDKRNLRKNIFWIAIAILVVILLLAWMDKDSIIQDVIKFGLGALAGFGFSKIREKKDN